MNKKHSFSTWLSLLLSTALTASCTITPAHWSDDTRAEIDQSLAQNSLPPLNTLPDDIQAALLPGLPRTLPVENSHYAEPRFDLATKNTAARAVFMSLVNDTPYSMVIHPEVKGTISLTLKNVTVDEAMETIRKVYGYEYKRDGNRYLVLGQGMQTRLFPVNYLNLNRKGFSDTRVSSGELTNSQDSDSSKKEGGSTESDHGIRVETQSDNNFWADLKLTLEKLIGEEEGRRVAVNPQAGLVVVHALPRELDIIENFLGITQNTVNRQVILEAKIIEVELKDSFQSGINWAHLGSADNTNFMASQIGGETLLTGTQQSNIASQVANLDPNAYSPLSSGITSAFGGIFSLAVTAPNFSAFIELLQAQGDVQVLSSPRISTVNNQKAVIKVGGDEFFVTGVKNSQTTTGSGTTQSPEVELTPFFSGIALDVTPQIDAEGNIILHIHPTISNVAQLDKSFVIGGENFSLPLAFSTIQESDNVVRSSNGQVVIIGGLMKEATTEANASVPLLGDIPVVGNLFKHKKLTRIKKELVILLKPSVINHHSNWRNAISESQRRTQQLNQARTR